MLKNIESVMSGRTIIAQADKKGIIEIQDIVLTADQTKKGSVELVFIDGTGREETIYKGEPVTAPISLTIQNINWRGWKGARLELSNVNNVSISCTVQCQVIQGGQSYGDWMAYAEDMKEEIIQLQQEGGEEVPEEKENEMQFQEIEMDIFASGIWNGDKYSDKDLELIVDSFNSIGNETKPYLKLGHNEEQKLAKDSGLFKDGMPAMGWIKSLKKVGNKLVAYVNDVPKVVAELIKSGAYKRVSSEIYVNYAKNGKKFPLALKAVSLLGADTPAVTTLQDVLALYEEDNTSQSKVIEFTKDFKEEVPEMDEKELEVKMAEQKAQIEKDFAVKQEEIQTALEATFKEKEDALDVQVKENEKKYSDIMELFGDVDDLKAAVLGFKDKQKEIEVQEKKYTEAMIKAATDEVEKYMDDMLKANKVLPRSASLLKEILLTVADSDKVVEFSDAELFGLKEKMTIQETVKAFVDSYPDMQLLKEFTSSSKNIKDKDAEAEELVNKYMKDNEVEYGEAQIAISKVRPELFETE